MHGCSLWIKSSAKMHTCRKWSIPPYRKDSHDARQSRAAWNYSQSCQGGLQSGVSAGRRAGLLAILCWDVLLGDLQWKGIWVLVKVNLSCSSEFSNVVLFMWNNLFLSVILVYLVGIGPVVLRFPGSTHPWRQGQKHPDSRANGHPLVIFLRLWQTFHSRESEPHHSLH